MKYEITKSFRFEGAHSLPHLPKGHQCRRMHGHSYGLIIGVCGELNENHWVQDYAEISAAVMPIVRRLDHHELNNILKVPTTAENLALYQEGIGHKTIASRLGISPRIARVILIEQGVWQPGKLKPIGSLDGPTGRMTRFRRAIQVIENKLTTRRDRMHIAMERVVARATKPTPKTWMEQYRSNPHLKVKHLLRKRIRKVITRGDQSAGSLALLGCSRAHFMEHMERQFKQGMTWGNLGVGRGHWNIDHIIPCAAFDLTKPADQRRCFHFTNLRPMWAIANIKKRAKVPPVHQWALL